MECMRRSPSSPSRRDVLSPSSKAVVFCVFFGGVSQNRKAYIYIVIYIYICKYICICIYIYIYMCMFCFSWGSLKIGFGTRTFFWGRGSQKNGTVTWVASFWSPFETTQKGGGVNQSTTVFELHSDPRFGRFSPSCLILEALSHILTNRFLLPKKSDSKVHSREHVVYEALLS